MKASSAPYSSSLRFAEARQAQPLAVARPPLGVLRASQGGDDDDRSPGVGELPEIAHRRIDRPPAVAVLAEAPRCVGRSRARSARPRRRRPTRRRSPGRRAGGRRRAGRRGAPGPPVPRSMASAVLGREPPVADERQVDVGEPGKLAVEQHRSGSSRRCIPAPAGPA